MNRILASLLTLAGIGGLYYFSLSTQYLFSYFTEPSNPLRHEYIQGALLALVLATPFWLAVSAFAFPLRKSLSKVSYIAINLPSILLVTGIVISTIIPLIMYTTGAQS